MVEVSERIWINFGGKGFPLIFAVFFGLWVFESFITSHHEGFDFGRWIRHPAEATHTECAQASGGLRQQAHDLAPGESERARERFSVNIGSCKMLTFFLVGECSWFLQFRSIEEEGLELAVCKLWVNSTDS